MHSLLHFDHGSNGCTLLQLRMLGVLPNGESEVPNAQGLSIAASKTFNTIWSSTITPREPLPHLFAVVEGSSHKWHVHCSSCAQSPSCNDGTQPEKLMHNGAGMCSYTCKAHYRTNHVCMRTHTQIGVFQHLKCDPNNNEKNAPRGGLVWE